VRAIGTRNAGIRVRAAVLAGRRAIRAHDRNERRTIAPHDGLAVPAQVRLARTCTVLHQRRTIAADSAKAAATAETGVDEVAERIVRRTISAAAIALADAIEQALPALGRPGAFDVLIAAYSLAAAFWQIANPPARISDAYAEEPELLPAEWNIEFGSALTRVLTATCIGSLPGAR